MPETLRAAIERMYVNDRRGRSATGGNVPGADEWAAALRKQYPEQAGEIDAWASEREQTANETKPAKPPGRFEASDFLLSAIDSAYQKDGAGRSPGAYIDQTARRYEEGGDTEKGRRLRDAWAQQEIKKAGKRRKDFEQADRAAGGVPGTPQIQKTQGVPWSGVDPTKMVDALEGAGLRTRGMLESEIRQQFHIQFGNQIQDDKQADAAADHLWVKRANEAASMEAEEYAKDNPGLPLLNPQRFDSPEFAKTYLTERIAVLEARKAQEGAESPVRHGVSNVIGAALRGITMNVPWQFRDDDLTAEDTMNALLGALFEGRDAAAGAMFDAEERQALAEYRELSPAVGLMLEGVELGMAFKGPLGLIGRAAHAGLRATKMGARAASWLSGPMSLGIFSALSTDGDLGERLEAGLHGAALAGIAGPAGRTMHKMLGFLPTRLAKAMTAESFAFVGAEWSLQGFELDHDQAVHAAMFGAMMGASGGIDPLLSKMGPHARARYKLHAKQIRKSWKQAMKAGWKPPTNPIELPRVADEVLRGVESGVKVPKEAPSTGRLKLENEGQYDQAIEIARSVQKANPSKSAVEVAELMGLKGESAKAVAETLGKETTAEVKAITETKVKPTKPKPAAPKAEQNIDTLLAQARRLREKGQGREVGDLASALKVGRATAERVDQILTAEGQEGGRIQVLAKKARRHYGTGPYPDAGTLGRRYGLGGNTARALRSRLMGEKPPLTAGGGVRAQEARREPGAKGPGDRPAKPAGAGERTAAPEKAPPRQRTVVRRPEKVEPKAEPEAEAEVGLTEAGTKKGQRIRDTGTGREGVIVGTRTVKGETTFTVEGNDGTRFPVPGAKAEAVKGKSMFARDASQTPPEPPAWRRPEGYDDDALDSKVVRKQKIGELRKLAEALELKTDGVKRRKLVSNILGEIQSRKAAAVVVAKSAGAPDARPVVVDKGDPKVAVQPTVEDAPPKPAIVATAPQRPRLDGGSWEAPSSRKPPPATARKQADEQGSRVRDSLWELEPGDSLAIGDAVVLPPPKAVAATLAGMGKARAAARAKAASEKYPMEFSFRDLWEAAGRPDPEAFRMLLMDMAAKGEIDLHPHTGSAFDKQGTEGFGLAIQKGQQAMWFAARGKATPKGMESPDTPAGESRISSGRDTKIISSSGEPIDGKYALVEGSDLLPSHDGSKDFQWSEGYPRENNLQERDYGRLPEEQAKVRDRIAAKLNPEELLNTAPRASEGPPTVSPDGTVLNGNGREMGRRLASEEAKAAYRKLLARDASHYGLTPEAVRSMKDPVLVRMVEMDPRTAEAATFARTGQETGTQGQSPIRMAARHAHLIGDRLFKFLRDTAEATVGEAVSDPVKGSDFRDALYKAIPAEERPTYFNEGRKLTYAGKELAENMLLVRGLSDPANPNSSAEAVRLIESMPDGLRNTLKSSAVQLVDMATKPGGRRNVDALQESVRYWVGPMQGTKETPKEFFSSLHVATAPPPPISAEGRMMLDFVHANRASAVKFRKGMKRLIEIREQESGLFAGESDMRAQMATALGVEEIRGVKMPDQSEFGMPDTFSSGRVNEMDPGYQQSFMPDPIMGPEWATPNRRTGFAQDMPLPTAEQTGWKGKLVRSRQIIRSLEKLVGTPIRVGHMDPATRMRAAGVYQVGPELVRLRYANDLPTGAHEAAHAIEKAVFWNLGKDPNWVGKLKPQIIGELTKLGQGLYGSQIPNGGYAREGFAEFVRFKLTDPKRVAGTQTDKWWNETFLKNNGKLGRRFAQSRELFDQYQQQGLENRKRAQVHKKKLGDLKTFAEHVLTAKVRFVEAGEVLARMSNEAETRIGRKLRPSEDPFALLTGLRLTHTARARYMVDTAMIDPAGNIRGSSLRDAAAIIQPHQRDGFTLYLWGRRAKERILGADAARLDWTLSEYTEAMGATKKQLAQVSADLGRPIDEVKLVWEGSRKGKHPGMSLEESMGLTEMLETPEFQIASQKVYKWNRQLLEYAYFSGAIDGPELQRILGGSQDYIPLQRAIESMSVTDAQRALQGGTPLKRMKGSGEEIRDPFESMVENAERLVRWSHEKMVTNALARLAIPVAEGGLGVEGLGKHIVEIPRDRIMERLPIASIESQLKKAGVDTKGMDPEAIIEHYRPAHVPKKGAPILSIKGADGKTRWFEVSRMLWDGVESMDVHRLPKAFDLVFGTPSRALRLGATGLRPAFALSTNPMRDFFVGYMQSKTTDNPATWAKEWGKSFGESFAAQFGGEFTYHDLFRRLGGEMAQPLGIDTRQTKRAAKELFTADSFKGRTVRVLKSPVDHLRDLLQFPENATRIAEVRRMAKQVGYKPGGPITLDQSLQMLTSGKRVSIDFTASGSWTRQINQVMTFFNASIQGTRSFMRAMKENPQKTTMKALASRTLPALTLWWMNKDEGWYVDMPWREKFSYFWIDPGGGELLAVPRAFDWDNTFSVMPEAVLDSIYRENPEGIAAAFGHIFETSPLGYIYAWENIPAITVPLELATNKSFFKDSPIVPLGQQNMPAPEQVAPYSSGIARWAGKVLDVSPRQVDHAIRGFTGGLVHDAAGWVDWTVSAVTGEQPGIGFRSPSRGTWKDFPVYGQATGRRGGKEGIGSKAVNRLFDDLHEARLVEGSTERDETGEERAYRMRLEDASIAIKFLRKIQGHASLTSDQSQELQKELRRIATEAVKDPEGGRMRPEKSDAKKRWRDLEAGSSTEQAPRRSMFER